MHKYRTIIFLILIISCVISSSVSAQVDLWTFGNEIGTTDGDIVFYQSWTSAHSDFNVHDITYSSDGLNVKGWILVPKSNGPHPVLIWNRGGAGPSADVKWYNSGETQTLYNQELFPYAAAGYVVVCTQYRYNGKKVAVANDTDYVPVYPAVASDYSSADDPFVESSNHDRVGGIEINDVINLLPLIRKLKDTGGNGGLEINVNLNRIAMMGMSRGGMETYITLRELSDQEKYGSLPGIKCAVIKGAVSHYPDWRKDIYDENTIFHYLYDNVAPNRANSANIAGNFGWSYPADYDDPGDPGYNFWSFFPNDSFPVWNDADMENDEWPESGESIPPAVYPYDQIYSEEYYYRSAVLWDNFWAQNTIPVLVLHGIGDNQVLYDDAQEMYDKITSVGSPSKYKLELYPDSDEYCSECAFLGSYGASLSNCDHWLVEYDYGREEVLAWLNKYIGIKNPALMLLLFGA